MSNNIISDKKSLRKMFLEARQYLTEEEVMADSKSICSQFITFFDQLVKKNPIEYFHVFLPISKFNEINTFLIIDHLLAHHSEIKIVVPKVIPSGTEMDNFIFNKSLKLKKNAWGILEPEDGEKVGAGKIDLVIAPLLIIDAEGQRLGYGKGYYDRFLEKCRTDVTKVGLSYYAPIKKISDAKKFDIKMNFCITPEKIYNF